MAEAREKEHSFTDFVINVRRVTKVTKGGKRFAFSALVVSGDKNGSVGIAQGKSRVVSSAIAKATNRARNNLIQIPLRGTTIPYNVIGRHGASSIVMRPAYKGTGVIAGGAVRSILEALGVQDVLAKSMGASNRMNVVKAALNALAQLRSLKHIAQTRGKTIDQVVKGSHEDAR